MGQSYIYEIFESSFDIKKVLKCLPCVYDAKDFRRSGGKLNKFTG